MRSPYQQQMLDAILQRSAEDLAFRRELLANPREAIEQAFGVVIPRTFNIRFVEREPGVDALVVLPDARHEGELSDDDLEAVSGGHRHPWEA